MMLSTTKVSAIGALAALSFTVSAHAASILYNVNQTIGAGSVVGTITTDGIIGTLFGGDITAYDLLLTGAGGATYTLTQTNSSVVITGSDTTATANDLDFNFSGTPGDYLLFQASLFSGMNYYCNAVDASTCFQGKSVVPQSFGDPSAQNVGAVGNQVIGVAGSVPEPASWAVMLLGFGFAGAVMRSRRTAILG